MRWTGGETATPQVMRTRRIQEQEVNRERHRRDYPPSGVYVVGVTVSARPISWLELR